MLVTVTLNVALDKQYVIDNLVPGEVMRVLDCESTAGGKGINAAKVIKLTGEETAAMGFIGGCSGAFIRNSMIQKGVIDFFTEVDGETRTCINVLEASTGRSTEFLETGVTISQKKLDEFIANYTKVVSNCEIVTLCGSVPTGIDVTIYPRLIEIAKKAGKRVILDSSGAHLKAGIDACPTVVKPNKDEIKTILGVDIYTKEDVIKSAKELHKRGIAIVIVSLGKEGAIVVSDEGVYQGTTPEVKVVNTVGCGDSMVGAFAVGLARNMPLTETFKLALAISTGNAMTKETGFFRQEDVDMLLEKVQVVKIG